MRNEVGNLADFQAEIDLENFFPSGIDDEQLALDMVKAGQEVMQKAIQNAAGKHKKTGSMASSVKCSKPVINRNGDVVGRIKFYGKDKNGMQNWSKALWIEYGAKNQNADPFVRPAIKSCESGVKTAMQKVFNEKLKF